MRILLAALLLALPAVSAAGGEWEITFRLQPDRTGQHIPIKSVKLADGRLQIEESSAKQDRRIKRDATAREAALIRDMIAAALTSAHDFKSVDRPALPRVEVRFDFDGGARTVEIEEHYAVGKVPRVYVKMQRIFFETTFD